MTAHRHITTDHDEIRGWVQAHHGAPARTAATTDTAGALHIDFAAVRPGELEHISWEEWFTAFDAQGLALCYPDPHVRGGASAWFELVPRAAAGFTREVSGVVDCPGCARGGVALIDPGRRAPHRGRKHCLHSPASYT